MEFNFDIEKLANNQISIDEIGHCCIKATNDKLEDHYLIIQTTLGKSLIFEYGPIVPDMKTLPDDVICTISQIDFKERRLKDIIDKFLNDPHKKIKYADAWPLNDCLDSCINLIEYTRNYENISS